jgi:hypothetical protein
MFGVDNYAAVRCFVFVEGHSRREAARVFGLNRETVLKMCRFSLPPGYTRTVPVTKITGHLREMYGIDVSPDLISTVTDAVLEEVAAWQARPLDQAYPLVFFDAIRVKIRDEGMVRNKAIHIALGNSGTGKTHVALALGLAACQKGFTTAFTTAAALVSQLLEARDERRLLKLQRDLASVKLLIIDELGYVPLSPTGAEPLFETFSQRYERGSTIVTSNLPFEDWTSVLGSERLTGALLDRLTHHVSILAMNGDSYRLKESAGRRRAAATQAGRSKTRPPPSTPIRAKLPKPDPHRRRRFTKRPPIGGLFVNNPAAP